MEQVKWTLHDAKNRFSAVVKAAQNGHPQLVTKRGVLTAVVISVEEYQEFQAIKQQQLPDFGEYLLSIPQSDIEFERMGPHLRDFDV